MACGRELYTLVNHICNPVLRVIRSQPSFFSPKVCFVSQFIRRSSVQPLFSINDSSTHKSGKTQDYKKKKKPLWYYDNKGIRQRKIDQLVRKALELNESGDTMGASEDVMHMRSLLYTFTKCDFNSKEVSALLFNKPRIFSLTKRKLYNCLMDLEDYGYSNDALKKMIMKSPGILLFDENKMSVQQRLSSLQQLKLTPRLNSERITYLVQKYPQLLSYKDISSLQSKINNLEGLGLNKQLVFELVMKYPNILTCSEESVKEKVKYVTEELGGRLTLFVKFPRVFSASLQRIKERYLYLVSEGYIHSKSVLTEKKLRAIVLTTDKDFIYRVTNTKMKDFREFQQQVRKEEAEKEFGDTSDGQKYTSSRQMNFNELSDELEDETNIENGGGYESGHKANLMKAFNGSKRNTLQDVEDWYKTPFPEINNP